MKIDRWLDFLGARLRVCKRKRPKRQGVTFRWDSESNRLFDFEALQATEDFPGSWTLVSMLKSQTSCRSKPVWRRRGDFKWHAPRWGLFEMLSSVRKKS